MKSCEGIQTRARGHVALWRVIRSLTPKEIAWIQLYNVVVVAVACLLVGIPVSQPCLKEISSFTANNLSSRWRNRVFRDSSIRRHLSWNSLARAQSIGVNWFPTTFLGASPFKFTFVREFFSIERAWFVRARGPINCFAFSFPQTEGYDRTELHSVVSLIDISV